MSAAKTYPRKKRKIHFGNSKLFIPTDGNEEKKRTHIYI